MTTEIMMILIGVLGFLVIILLIKLLKGKPPKETPDAAEGTLSNPPPIIAPPLEDWAAERELHERLIREKLKTVQILEERYSDILASNGKLSTEAQELIRLIEKERLAAEEMDRNRADYLAKQQFIESSIAAKEQELQELVASVQSILDEQKRKALEDSYYKLHIAPSSQDKITDIETFAARYPEIKNAITSVIYSHFYSSEVGSLCNRVLGLGRKVTGIYKITNTLNGMVYVGKSVDIRNRWTQHIKRAVGAEKETQNLLYPAMREYKIWNFSFEVLEECDKDDLTAREKFYQDVYKAKEDYSIK